MTQASMGRDVLPSTELLFEVKVEPSQAPASQPIDAPRTRRALALADKVPVSYDTLFTLQPTQFSFTQSKDQMYHASLEFDLVAYDPFGKVLAVRSQTMKLPLTPEEYEEFVRTPFQFFMPIDLPSGEVTLRLGVFDAVSNKGGTLQIPLAVQRTSGAVSTTRPSGHH